MKVLFISQWYPTREEPMVGVFVREFARAVSLSDEVRVLHCAMDPGLRQRWQIELDRDPALTEGILTYRDRYRRGPIPGTTYPFYLASGLQAFRRIRAAGFAPDIIHAHVFEAGVLGTLISRLYHVPLVVSEHWSGFPRKLLGRGAILRARLAFGTARAVLPVSHALQRAIEAYGIRRHFQVVPNVVDIRRFHPADCGGDRSTGTRLLFVGSLDAEHIKGVPHLLRALAELQFRRLDWRVDVVGGGPAQPEYERLAAELQLGDRVVFHGQRPKREVADFMARADIFVLPSVWDNMPCVLIEAMASGLPILSTTAGGIPEIVTDEALGRLCAAGRLISTGCGSGGDVACMGQYDRQKIALAARRYSLQSVGATLHALYEGCRQN